MRLVALLLASAVGLTLSACGDVELPRYKETSERPRLKTVSQLECPESQGDLTRARVEPNGACVYAAPQGGEVVLRLVSLQGDAGATLAPIETELQALLPRVGTTLAAPPTPPATPGTGEAAGENERVNVNLPGVRIQTEGENAIVRLPGIKIEADERKAGDGETTASAKVNISVGDKQVVVNARDDASEIRASEDDGSDLQRTYLLVDERGSEAGWRMAGYMAAGPQTGPLVVAVVKGKSAEGGQDEAFRDAKKLLERNVGKLR